LAGLSRVTTGQGFHSTKWVSQVAQLIAFQSVTPECVVAAQQNGLHQCQIRAWPGPNHRHNRQSHTSTNVYIYIEQSFLRRRINSRHCRPGDLWCWDHIKHGRFSRVSGREWDGVPQTETKCGLSTLEVCARLG